MRLKLTSCVGPLGALDAVTRVYAVLLTAAGAVAGRPEVCLCTRASRDTYAVRGLDTTGILEGMDWNDVS